MDAGRLVKGTVKISNPLQQHNESDEEDGVAPPRAFDSARIFQALEDQAAETLVQEEDVDRGMCAAVMLSAVRPDHPARLAWDVYILALVVYSSLSQPYAIAFSARTAMTALDWFVDISFYLDIVLNFWTGFDKGFEVILDKRHIVKNYLGTWFTIDLLATIEWDLIIAMLRKDSDETSTFIRMTRLLKVLRLARMGRLISRLTAGWTVNTAFIEAAKFFFYVASESDRHRSAARLLFVLLDFSDSAARRCQSQWCATCWRASSLCGLSCSTVTQSQPCPPIWVGLRKRRCSAL